jgi:hypothetical protein
MDATNLPVWLFTIHAEQSIHGEWDGGCGVLYVVGQNVQRMYDELAKIDGLYPTWALMYRNAQIADQAVRDFVEIDLDELAPDHEIYPVLQTIPVPPLGPIDSQAVVYRAGRWAIKNGWSTLSLN